MLESNKLEDALKKGHTFRKMISYIECKYPEIKDDILTKILNITNYEIRTLTYTNRQYKQLEQYFNKIIEKYNSH